MTFYRWRNPNDGASGRYDRKPARDHVLSGTVTLQAELKSGTALPVQLQLVRCPLEPGPRFTQRVEVVAVEVVARVSELTWEIDTTQFPDGQYALTFDQRGITQGVIIDNGGYDPTIPQYVCLAPLIGLTGRSDEASGWCWVLWPGHRPTLQQVKRPPKPATPIQGRPAPADLYCERYGWCYGNNHSPWEFRINDNSYPSTIYKHQYHSSGLDTLSNGHQRDGYIGEGSIDNQAGGFVHPSGDLIIACRTGRVVRGHLDGYIETIAGWRLPAHIPNPLRTANIRPHEQVGTYLDGIPELAPGCHDVCGDTDDPDIVYIADTGNHCIRRCNINTGELSVLIGHRDGTKGYQNGLSEPRGLDMREGVLAIADYRNLRIVFCDRTGNVLSTFESIRPSGQSRFEEFPDWDGTQIIPQHFTARTARIRQQARWGTEGQAAFLYPVGCRFDSAGDLIITHDRQQQASRLRLDDVPSLEWLADLTPDTTHDTYPLLSVDRWGAYGETDDWFTGNWEHGSHGWYSKDGARIGPIQNSNARAVLWDGAYLNSNNMRYDQWAVVGSDGSLWCGGLSGAGIHRYRLRQPGDKPQLPTNSRLRDAAALWEAKHRPDLPLLYLIGGIAGQGQFGAETFDTLALKADPEIADYIRTDLLRPDMTDAEMAEIIHYIRAEAIPDAELVVGGEPVEPPSESPVEDEPPEVEPDSPEEITVPSIVAIVEGKEGWSGGLSRWSRKINIDIPDVPNRVLLINLCTRSDADVIVPNSNPGEPDSPRVNNHATELLIRDPERLGGKSNRGVQVWVLRDPPVGPAEITWELGRIGDDNRNSSGRMSASAIVIRDAGHIRSAAQAMSDTTAIELPSDAGPQDLVLSVLSSGKHDETQESFTVDELTWRDRMGGNGPQVYGAGSQEQGVPTVRWDGHPGDAPQAMALAVIAISPAAAAPAEDPPEDLPEDPPEDLPEDPPEEPPVEEPEEPGSDYIGDARQAIIEAQESLSTALTALESNND